MQLCFFIVSVYVAHSISNYFFVDSFYLFIPLFRNTVSFLSSIRLNISNTLLLQNVFYEIYCACGELRKYARFEFLTAAWPMIRFLWEVTLCRHGMTDRRTEISTTNSKYSLHIGVFLRKDIQTCGPEWLSLYSDSLRTGPGIEAKWGWDFSHPSRPALGPTQHSIQWELSLSFPGTKRPGRRADHPPWSSAEVKEKVELTSTFLWAFMSCSRDEICPYSTYKPNLPLLYIQT